MYFQIRQREAIRLCLKHFRQHNFTEAFDFLQQKSQIQLEDPMLSELFKTLVKDGNYEASEEIITKAVQGKFKTFSLFNLEDDFSYHSGFAFKIAFFYLKTLKNEHLGSTCFKNKI